MCIYIYTPMCMYGYCCQVGYQVRAVVLQIGVLAVITFNVMLIWLSLILESRRDLTLCATSNVWRILLQSIR